MILVRGLVRHHTGLFTQVPNACRVTENSQAPGQKIWLRPPESKASRRLPMSRKFLWKITVGLLYEAFIHLEALGAMSIVCYVHWEHYTP